MRTGLRTRLTLAFALGALALSLMLAALTYQLARTYLLGQRESALVRQAYLHAALISRDLRVSDPDVPEAMSALETAEDSQVVVVSGGEWFATSVAVGRGQLPEGLRERALGGDPVRQRFSLRGVPQLAVGVPMPVVGATYFEVFSLDVLEQTLAVLRNSLAVAAAATTIAGIAVGRWASRRVLRPVAAVAGAAAAVAAGELDTRMETDPDPDLTTVAASFNHMAAALQERIAREARFASAVSHELRSPLTTVVTAAELLSARRNELPERSQVALDLLTAEVARFQRLVQDLLEISRLDAGAVDVALEEVHLPEFVQHALVTAPGSPRLEVAPDAVDVVVLADKRRLERVIANLVENAALHGGGADAIRISSDDGRVQLAVEDHGSGVPEAERDRIFERFVRGRDGARRGASDGSGLGLSLVREHVRLHGGTVHVEDRPGGGARFVVDLPRHQP